VHRAMDFFVTFRTASLFFECLWGLEVGLSSYIFVEWLALGPIFQKLDWYELDGVRLSDAVRFSRFLRCATKTRDFDFL